MTCNPREFIKLSDGAAPLAELEQRRHAGTLSEQGALRAAATVHLPVVAVRGLLSWYADLQTDPNAMRVCRGTSCRLAGAPDATALHSNGRKCAAVYCVGYCDRSPALLTPDDTVLTGYRVDAAGEIIAGTPGASQVAGGNAPAPTDIRCTAGAPIVTGRLTGSGCAAFAAARAAGVYSTIESALGREPGEILAEIERAGVRGRGGAGFPTGRKWRTCARAPGDHKYIIANGDEGDPGSFIDRELMERDPHAILEGMLLAAHAVGAREGIVFIRSEYPRAVTVMQRAIEEARGAGLLGAARAGRLAGFDVRVVTGLGSYVCGEETAMLNAIEGKRGEARPRPPYPAEEGLFGRPTVVDNVETLVNIPWIVRNGAAAYRALGTAACPGTKALCLNHGFARPGIVEVEFGVSLRRVIDDFARGPAGGQTLDALLLGGPMGSIVPPDEWDVPVCIEAMSRRGIRLGHGGIVALAQGTNYAALLRDMLEFVAEESCGKCVPCRIGSQRARELVCESGLTTATTQALGQIFDLMEQASLCGFGREAPGPIRQLIERLGARKQNGGGR